jgi:hypothetical protein
MPFLLDSNVVINYLEGSLSSSAIQRLNIIVDEEPIVSVLTKIETLGFNFKTVEQQTIIETFINNSNILELNNEIVNKTIELRKSKKIKLPDAIIAATAIVHQLTLISSDSDFNDIQGLTKLHPKNL